MATKYNYKLKIEYLKKGTPKKVEFIKDVRATTAQAAINKFTNSLRLKDYWGVNVSLMKEEGNK